MKHARKRRTKAHKYRTKKILLFTNDILLILSCLLIPVVLAIKGYTMSTTQDLFLYIILGGIWFILSYAIKGIFGE